MKILFVDEGTLQEINKKIDINEFLKENKLVILSKNPYIVYSEDVIKSLEDNNIYGSSLDSIMHIANGRLANFFVRESDEQNNKYLIDSYRINVNSNKIKYIISNYGPNLSEEDLLLFPIKYYTQKYDCKELEILFYSKNYFRKRFAFNVNKLYETYRNLIEKDEDTTIFGCFHTVKLPDVEEKKNIQQAKKITFCDAEGIFYHYTSDYHIDKIKCSLEEYLREGNFLALLSETGNHYGELFTIDKIPVLDTIENEKMHKYLIDYFKSLSIDPNQVYSFKCGSVGLNFEGNSCNLGFSNMTFSSRKKLSIYYLEYLKSLGYNISEVNFLTYPIITWMKQGWSEQQNDLKIMASENNGIYHLLESQEDFNNVILKKILKR